MEGSKKKRTADNPTVIDIHVTTMVPTAIEAKTKLKRKLKDLDHSEHCLLYYGMNCLGEKGKITLVRRRTRQSKCMYCIVLITGCFSKVASLYKHGMASMLAWLRRPKTGDCRDKHLLKS